MKLWVWFFFVLNMACVGIRADDPQCSIAFVHLGKTLPEYLPDALLQARLFNTGCTIYLLANQEALDSYHDIDNLNIICVPVETLIKTKTHEYFINKSTLDRKGREGFWFYASERFLYLDDFMQQHNIEHLLHLESDAMLYTTMAELMPIFLKHYPHLAAVFDNDERCIACFVYAANKESMHQLAECFLEFAAQKKTDMDVLALFKKKYPEKMGNLPIIMDSYRKKYPLQSNFGHIPADPTIYSKHIHEFQSVFDAAALGHYLGGQDPRNGESKPGFINERCLFNPSYMGYVWQTDNEGRKVPYMVFEDEIYKINNLHIHSKNLKKFLSVDRSSAQQRFTGKDIQKNAVVPLYSGGRFGDTLVSIAHALYFALKNNCDMFYTPFPYAEQLLLDTIIPHFTPEIAQQYKKTYTFPGSSSQLKEGMQNTLIKIPYFPESNVEYTKEYWPYFLIDWENETFKEILHRILTPKNELDLVEPPHNKISIAVHMRKGGSYDNWPEYYDGILLYKNPLNAFYINEIKTIAALFPNSPLYVFIFTDDENPHALAHQCKTALNNPSIEFDYRKENNNHSSNVLEDFYSMMHFDVLIRPESSYSIMAEKVGDHAIVISPGDFLKNLRVQRGLIKIKKPLDTLRRKIA